MRISILSILHGKQRNLWIIKWTRCKCKKEKEKKPSFVYKYAYYFDCVLIWFYKFINPQDESQKNVEEDDFKKEEAMLTYNHSINHVNDSESTENVNKSIIIILCIIVIS